MHSGESADVELNIVLQGREDFQNILLDYNADDIYNLDEFGLFWKILPDRFDMCTSPSRCLAA